MGRSNVDVALLHPPSVYDFRKTTIFYGSISDVVPSTPVFEMYPIGFLSLTTFLEKLGYRVRIVNLAVRMLRDFSFDVERYLSKIEADLYGIDLHWMVSAHGAIEIAKLLKEQRPDAPIAVGGFAATYFHEELIQHPCIDFILRGDTAEEPMAKLLQALERNGDFGEVPNLTWKEDGRVRSNPLSYVPAKLDEYAIDYELIYRSAKRERALDDYAPFASFYESPIGAVLTAKGCLFNCAFCGGSRFSYRCFLGRAKVATKEPETIVEEIKSLINVAKIPVFVLYDLRFLGRKRAFGFFEAARREIGDASLIFEIYAPADREFLQALGRSGCEPYLQISPNTQDEGIRARYGMPYSNVMLVKTIENALEAGVGRIDLYFMLGLSGQTLSSCLQIPDFVDRLIARYGAERLSAFAAPLTPFLDVGSPGFENPELGYKVLFRDFESFRRALTMPSWKLSLNYEVDSMTAEELVDATYLVAMRLAEVKGKHGILSEGEVEDLKCRIEFAHDIIKRIDKIVAEQGPSSPELDELREIALREIRGPTIISTKRELWPQIGRLRAFLIKLRSLLWFG